MDQFLTEGQVHGARFSPVTPAFFSHRSYLPGTSGITTTLNPAEIMEKVRIAMERQPIKSVILRSAGYDAEKKVLEIEFTSGQVHQFHAVPEKVWTGLRQSAEAGKFFTEKIRPKFQSRQVAGHP